MGIKKWEFKEWVVINKNWAPDFYTINLDIKEKFMKQKFNDAIPPPRGVMAGWNLWMEIMEDNHSIFIY
jgi:hypothetical protein